MYIQMLFRLFLNKTTDIRVVGKMADHLFNVFFFGNLGDKVLIFFLSRGQICSIAFSLVLLLKTPSALWLND